MKITIGDVATGNVVVIDDGGNKDRDQQTADVIKFDSAGAQPPGFTLPPNSSVSRIRGTVKLAVVGTVVQFLPPGGASLVLTDLRVTRAANAGAQALTVLFEHDIAGFPAPITAGECLEADLSDMNGQTLNGTSITWKAYVDTTRIQPPNVAFTYLGAAGPPAAVQLRPPPGGPMQFPTGGPQWTLKGELTILLATQGHSLWLPNSAEVGIAPTPRDFRQQKPAT